MAATLDDIRQWLLIGKSMKDITHMLVVCDTFDFEDYPVYVNLNRNVREVYNEFDGKDMQSVMEVYSYRLNLDRQLEQKRSLNFD